MLFCPDCGKLVNYRIEYSHGQPRMMYYCSCGYDSRKVNFVFDRIVNVKRPAADGGTYGNP